MANNCDYNKGEYSLDTVICTQTKSYEQALVTDSVRRHFEMLSLKKLIKPDMRVLLKPNLLMKRSPNETTTTHPAILAGIVVCLRELGVSSIMLADSPGGPYSKTTLNAIYEGCGMKKMALEYGVTLNENTENFERKSKDYKAVSSFTLIKPIENADLIINIAKLKTHAMTTLSGGVKNLFGTIPGLMKPEFHLRFPDKNDFSQMLCDLCETVKPDVTFVDAIDSMEGNGPSGGTKKHTGMILSSLSPYSVDLTIAKIMNVKPHDVPTLSCAIGRNLCKKSADELTFLGDSITHFSDFKMPDAKSIDFEEHVPKLLRKPTHFFLNALINPHPVIKKSKCIGCGKCAESCPAHTIKIESGKAVIYKSECIKCFCCHEMCPVKAIDIKRAGVLKL